MKRTFVLIGLVALAAGCNSKGNEQAFSDKFDKGFRSSCVSSSMQGGVPADVSNQVCDCAIAAINKKFSAREKLTMTEEQARPMMLECLNKAVQK